MGFILKRTMFNDGGVQKCNVAQGWPQAALRNLNGSRRAEGVVELVAQRMCGALAVKTGLPFVTGECNDVDPGTRIARHGAVKCSKSEPSVASAIYIFLGSPRKSSLAPWWQPPLRIWGLRVHGQHANTTGRRRAFYVANGRLGAARTGRAGCCRGGARAVHRSVGTQVAPPRAQKRNNHKKPRSMP